MTKYASAKTGEYPSNIQNCMDCEKYLNYNKHNSPHVAQKYAWIFCPWTFICVPQSSQFSLLGTDNFQSQTPSIFLYKMEAITFMLFTGF